MKSIPKLRPAVVYTVSRLNRETRFLLNDNFGQIWVEGEISNYSASPSGHHYFTLKDAEAQVRCALFKGQARLSAIRLNNGMQVLVRADVSLYEPRGDYQLIALQIEEAGDGVLMRAFEALKQRLLTEGLFDTARKRLPPTLPACIGIITSPTGAAIRDILTVLNRRFPAIPVLIFPTRVQGKEAATEIIRALETADRSGLCDVLILARGGGSLEDLWTFNEEAVARTIAHLKTPLVTGIGHEVDYTIADFVADLRAPTPSAAAEAVTPDVADWLKRLERLSLQLHLGFTARLKLRQKQWGTLDKRLRTQHPKRQLENQSQRLDELKTRLVNGLSHHLHRTGERLRTHEAQLARHHPRQRLNLLTERHTHLKHRLIAACQKRLDGYRHQTAALAEQLQTVSPLATLARGYSITRRVETGELLRSITPIQPGDRIETHLANGKIISRVEAIGHETSPTAYPAE